MTATGEIEDPELTELYINFYNLTFHSGKFSFGNNSTVYEDCSCQKHGGTFVSKRKLILGNAKVLKIDKDKFMRAVGGRTNNMMG